MSAVMIEPRGVATLELDPPLETPLESKFKEEVDYRQHAEQEVLQEPLPRPSMVRVVLLTICIIMTFFLGVGPTNFTRRM
jgi:hypothetical protein